MSIRSIAEIPNTVKYRLCSACEYKEMGLSVCRYQSGCSRSWSVVKVPMNKAAANYFKAVNEKQRYETKRIRMSLYTRDMAQHWYDGDAEEIDWEKFIYV